MKPQTLATSLTQSAQPPLSSASSFTSIDEPAVYESKHWDAVGEGIKQEFRSARLNALEEINLVIYKLMYSNESFSGEELHEARQTSRGLLEARDHGDIETLEREFTNFISGAMKKLLALEGGGLAKTSAFAKYGGVAGDTIFRRISADVVVPVLTSFLSKFSDQTKDLNHEDQLDATKAFLHSFLMLAGKERGRIAEMTATEEFEAFGRLNENGRSLVDPVAAWPPWETMMIDKINEMISPAWEDFRTNHEDGEDAGQLVPLRRELLLQKGNLSLVLTRSERQGRLFDSTKGEREMSHFTLKWPSEKDGNKAIAHPFAVTGIMCVHPARDWRKAEDVVAPDLLDALRWTHDPQQLQDKLASIFYDLSHSSTFDRGGASISEMMIKAIAARHGYVLEFSPDWTPPDHVQPDQQALSEFDREKFIQAARKHMILHKIEQGSL